MNNQRAIQFLTSFQKRCIFANSVSEWYANECTKVLLKKSMVKKYTRKHAEAQANGRVLLYFPFRYIVINIGGTSLRNSICLSVFLCLPLNTVFNIEQG